MKIGSIVECINDSWDYHASELIMPVKGRFYTVIGLCEYRKGKGLYLAECCDIIGVTHKGILYKYDVAPFLESRFIEADPAMKVLTNLSKKLAYQAEFKLDWMLNKFESSLNIQMDQLQHGSNYVNEIIDSIIVEIESDRILGSHEYAF